MNLVEPPPDSKPDKKKSKEKFTRVLIDSGEERQIAIQKVQIRDVEEILELVNGFAAKNLMLPRGPQYVYENIRDFVITSDRNVPVYSLTETREVLHLIVACGSLHVLWDDIGEIKWIRFLISFFDRIYRINGIFFACGEILLSRRPLYPYDPVNPV